MPSILPWNHRFQGERLGCRHLAGAADRANGLAHAGKPRSLAEIAGTRQAIVGYAQRVRAAAFLEGDAHVVGLTVLDGVGGGLAADGDERLGYGGRLGQAADLLDAHAHQLEGVHD